MIEPNVWVYEKVCLDKLQFDTKLNSKLSYTPCYTQYGILKCNVCLEY